MATYALEPMSPLNWEMEGEVSKPLTWFFVLSMWLRGISILKNLRVFRQSDQLRPIQINQNRRRSRIDVISGVYGVQMVRLPSAVNGIDPYELTRAIIRGRKLVRECTRFLVGKVTGLEQAAIVQTNEKLAIRETRRVLGEHILTAEEILNGTKFDDGIGANAWPVEIHTPGTLETRVLSLKGDGFCTIPYRCLIPQKIENLLMAGRFISCTHEAQSSIRVMGPASVMGQAIATARSAIHQGKSISQKIENQASSKRTGEGWRILGMSFELRLRHFGKRAMTERKREFQKSIDLAGGQP